MGTVSEGPPGYIYLQSDICCDLDRVKGQTGFQSNETFLAHLLDLHAKYDVTGTRAVRVSQNLACRFTALQGSFESSDDLMKYLLQLFSRTLKDAAPSHAVDNPPSRKKSRKSQPKRNLKVSIFHKPEDDAIDVESSGQSQDGCDLVRPSGAVNDAIAAVNDAIAESTHVGNTVMAGVHQDYKGIGEAFNIPAAGPVDREPRGDKQDVPMLTTVKLEKDTDTEGPLCLRLHQPRSDTETRRPPAVHRPRHDPYPAPDTIASMRGEIHSVADGTFGTPPRHGLPQWRSSSEPLSDARLSASGSHVSPQKPLSLQVSPQAHIGDCYTPMASPCSLRNAVYQKMDAENNNIINVNRPYPILGKILDKNKMHQENNEDIDNTHEDSDGYNYVLNSLANSPKNEGVMPCSISPHRSLQVPLQYPQPSPYTTPSTPVETDEPEDLSFKSPDKEMPNNLTMLTPPKRKLIINPSDPTAVNQITAMPGNQNHLTVASNNYLTSPVINPLTPTLPQGRQLTPTQIRQLAPPNQLNPPNLVNSDQNFVKFDKNGNALLSPVFQFPNGFPVQTRIMQMAANTPIQNPVYTKNETKLLIGQPAVGAPPPKFRPIAQKGTAPGTTQVSFVANAQGNQQSIVLAASAQANNVVVNIPNGNHLPKPALQTTVPFQHQLPPLLVSNVSTVQSANQVQIVPPQTTQAVFDIESLDDESLKRKRKRMDDSSIFRDPPESSLPFNGPQKYRFYCDVCDTGFTRRYTFNRHKCKGRVEKHYCQLCDKAYLSKYKLKDHVLVKHEGQTVSCPDCGKRFSSRSSMEMHKKQQHEGQFSIFCKVCGKGFNHTGHYYGHMNKHTNTKPFWCQQCGKRFFGSSYLHNHKQVCRSDAEFNYACNQCDRRFKCELYLKKHQKVHETTPLIYQATGGMQLEADEAVCMNDPDVDIMDVGSDKLSREEDEDDLVIDESDDDEGLVIDCSTSPQGAAFPGQSERGMTGNDSGLSEAQPSPRLSSVAHIGQESITA